MMNRIGMAATVFVAVFVAVALVAASAALPPETVRSLESSPYVYIASTRKDGSLGKPAEIWFHWREGSVCVGTRPDSWRVRRIRAGRAGAQIWVGKPDGPSFSATGAIVEDRSAKESLLEAFAVKYPDRWPRWEKEFRKGLLDDGTRVLVCYSPRG